MAEPQTMNPRNDKPPLGGLTQPGVRPYSRDASRGRAKITMGNMVVNRTLPRRSGTLDGETTRRVTLNLHRGGQPVGARRIVGKRKWQQGNL